MKKKITILCCVVLVASAAAVTGHRMYLNSQMSDLMRANLEVLTQTESSNTMVRNFKSSDVWIVTGLTGQISIHLTDPGFTFGGTKTRYKCCIQGTDMDGCDFSKENAECAQYVIRPAH